LFIFAGAKESSRKARTAREFLEPATKEGKCQEQHETY
jgi:hypothetical protein